MRFLKLKYQLESTCSMIIKTSKVKYYYLIKIYVNFMVFKYKKTQSSVLKNVVVF